MNATTTRRQLAAGALVLGVAFAAAACLGISTRGQASAEITGPDGTSVMVVTSTQFTQTQGSSGLAPDTAGADVRILTADTSRHTIPATVSRELTDTQRIYLKVALDDSASASGSGPLDSEIRLDIDGEQRASASGDLRETPLVVSFTSYVQQ